MYAKLALNNAKKSIRDYLIYFITITLCVSLFYAFLSLSSDGYELITEETYSFEMLKNILKNATYIITAFMAVLIGYVNQYIMKRRQREFATCILLGTDQKSVAFMFFIETLIMGIAAVFLGILAGTFFSQVVTALVLLTAKQEIIFRFQLYPDTILLTFVFFLCMFCVIGFYNIMVLKKQKLIHMINAEKRFDFQFKRSGKVYLSLFAVSILLFSVCGYCTYQMIQAVDSVSKASGKESVFSLIALAAFIVATYALFYSLAYIIIVIKERWICFKYEGANLFLIGSIVSKIKSMPVLMATISLTFLGAVVSFIVTLILSQWSLGYLDYRIPYDISITNENNVQNYFNITDINDIPSIDYEEVIAHLDGADHNIKDYCILEKYFLNEEDFYRKEKTNIPLLAVRLSDFNKLRGMLGYEQVLLADNEFTTQWHRTSVKETMEEFVESNPALRAGVKELRISSTPYYNESIGEGSYNHRTEAIIILPDAVCKELTLAGTDLYADFNEDMSYEEAVRFEDQYIQSWMKDNYGGLLEKYDTDRNEEKSYMVYVNIKGLEKGGILNATLAIRILGIYLGVVLLMISLTVLALQQLSDSIEHKERFRILRKLGVDEKDMSKIVLKQISIYFIIPISIALIGVFLFVYHFFNMYAAELTTYIGDKAFVFNIILALIFIIGIYTCYFVATYYTFKRNIK